MGLFQFTAILVVKLHFFFKVVGWLRTGVLQVWKQSQIINQFRPAKRSLESEIWVTEIYLQRVHISKGERWRQKKSGRPYSQINWLLCTVWSTEIVPSGVPSKIHQQKGGSPLEFINQKGSASRLHQVKGKGGQPLEFINKQPQNARSASRDNFSGFYVTS